MIPTPQPYPAYKPSGVQWMGDVPAHWEVKRLKYSAPIRVSKLDRKPEEATYVGLEHIESSTGQLLLESQPESVDSVVGLSSRAMSYSESLDPTWRSRPVLTSTVWLRAKSSRYARKVTVGRAM